MKLSEVKQYLAEGSHFAKGSMAPKIQAVIWYLEHGGKRALITNSENIGRALKGETGTWILPEHADRNDIKPNLGFESATQHSNCSALLTI